MSLEMVRIDDRFIHGQVVVGWCPHVNPDRLILCDDEIATSEWEREIYQNSAMEYATSICTIEATTALLRDQNLDKEKLFLLVNSPHVLVELIEAGIKINEVVVGGMHFEDGKRKITNFIYISDDDLEDFRFLFRRNVKLEARDLPTCKPIDLARKLGLN